MKIIKIFRTRPQVGRDNIIIAISENSGETWKPIAFVEEIHIESAILDGRAGESSGVLGEFQIFHPIVNADYWKDGKPLGKA